MSSEPTPTGSEPHPNPPVDSGVSPTAPDDAVKSSLDGKVESLKKAVVSILEGTEWPPDSTDPAKSLIKAINNSPNIATNNSRTTKELQNLVEKYIEILDDIQIRLKDASSKAAMRRWKFLQRIKSMTSNRPSKCALLFQTCQDDLLKAIKTLNERLEYEGAKDNGSAGGPESLSNVNIHSTGRGGADSLVQGLVGTAEHASTSDDSTPNLPIPAGSLLNAPPKLKDRGLISDEVLSISRKTFKSVEIASGAIPVVGTYIGAAAKVGLAFVETLQTMDRNNSLATDLGEHTSKLNKLVEKFKGRSSVDEKDMVDQIEALHKELVLVNEQVEEWIRLGRFKKAFLAREHGETLKEYQGRIQTAREEMQVRAKSFCGDLTFLTSGKKNQQ